jgi:hypothetical protein
MKHGLSYEISKERFDRDKKHGMWYYLNKLIKPNGAIVLFGNEPFSSALRMSNIKNYKYDLIWKKNIPTGFFNAKKQQLKIHENISIFYNNQPVYNPQMVKRSEEEYKKNLRINDSECYNPSVYGGGRKKLIRDTGKRTMAEVISEKFGNGARLVAAIVIIIYAVSIVAINIAGLRNIIIYVFGEGLAISIPVATAIAAIIAA